MLGLGCPGSGETTTYVQGIDGRLAAVTEVPVQTCPQCGEQYFSPETVDRLQRLLTPGADGDPPRDHRGAGLPVLVGRAGQRSPSQSTVSCKVQQTEGKTMVQLYGKTWTRAELTRYVADMAQLGGIRPSRIRTAPRPASAPWSFGPGRASASPSWPTARWTSGWPRSTACRSRFMTGVGYAHPAYYSGHESDWLQTFPGGLFVTGGLDTYGQPAKDEGQAFGLHGRATSLAARGLSWDADWDGDEYVLGRAAR